MIARGGNKGFLAAHYDWLALGVGLIALVFGIAYYVSVLGEDPDGAAADAVARIDRMKPKDSGVAPFDMTGLQAATSLIRKPVPLAEVGGKDGDDESFLASERRVLCKCGKAISGDIRQVPVCPYCGERQLEEKKAVLDANGNGLPDDWEERYGLKGKDAAADADPDGDGFTNLEEFKAGTDPKLKADHPDYLNYLKIELPLKETFLPFVFRKANKIPAGWRCEFFDPSRKDDYGRKGATLTAVLGEEIADTKFVLKDYTPKTVREAIKGGEGLTKAVDASEVVVERKQDGKRITLVAQQGKSVKRAAIDTQATLVYKRGAGKRFEVVPGSEIVLSGTKYKIVAIRPDGKGVKVTVQNVQTGRERTLEALES